jgi:hypothetical protein
MDGFASHSTGCVYLAPDCSPGSRSAAKFHPPKHNRENFNFSSHSQHPVLRGDAVADPGDDLERPVSRILIVDEGQDHQLVGRRFVDQRLGPMLHRLWRADDDGARPVFDARALLNGSERVKVSRGPQQRAACSAQVFYKDLLKRGEETLRPCISLRCSSDHANHYIRLLKRLGRFKGRALVWCDENS